MLEQSATALASAKAAKAQYERLVAQDINALTLLAGVELDAEILSGASVDAGMLKALPEGVKSDALLVRPDIKRAEHVLKAANADIGAARAAFFPSITLTGTAGLASTGLDDLFKSGSSLAWTFAPRVNLPIFNMGRTRANLASAKTSQKIAAAQYEKAVQNAFREVADQLAAKGTLISQLEAQESLAESSRTVYDLAERRYEHGISGYLDVLDAQRSLFSSQQSLINVKRQYLTNLVTLYKVLGGGQI